jgi:hypothetical protein
MDFVRSWKFSMIVFAVLCVCGIAGVIVGVHLHEEPGLMEDAPRWDSMPLTVCVHPYEPGDAETAARCDTSTRYVAGLVNERLGFTAYVVEAFYVDRTCEVDVTCGYPADEANEPGGSALLTPGRCDVRIVNVHGELQTLAVHHELGHCLGLADEDGANPHSIMEDIRETPPGTLPPWISDDDRAVLRALYGGAS